MGQSHKQSKRILGAAALILAGLILAIPVQGSSALPASGTGPIFLPMISLSGPPVQPIQGGSDPAINAVGDIAACSPSYGLRDGYLQTAALLQQLDGPILGLGDYVYTPGTPAYFTNCFDPVWGQFKTRIFPSPGNHEYYYPAAGGYYGYFGAAAGDPSLGYYSFNLGRWHIVALNANCSDIGAPGPGTPSPTPTLVPTVVAIGTPGPKPTSNGCSAGSSQEQWLRADLAAHPALCTLAFWHQPLFSSGTEGNDPQVRDLFQALIDNHVDLVINGHDHSYERFAPQDVNGLADPVNGITEIIAGTGGKDHSALVRRLPNSLVFDNTTFGVLRVVLHPAGYDFQFIPVAGGTFTDSGSGSCH